jgi:nitrite reductase/ring-hydroxylating ferredoxin subunit
LLSKEENELICQTGPGTPMGSLMRRYWLPVLLSSEVPTADCPPVRAKVLSEDLVAFRDSNGTVGLLDAHCPHRGASLFFGRNENEGLRCVYHGWKFDVAGNCVDMPSEPAESNFKQKVKVQAYPTVESAGMVWAYLGPPDRITPFREFAFHALSPEQWIGMKVPVYCNYLQSMEGNVDSFHSSYLHRDLRDARAQPDETDRPGYPSWAMSVVGKATSRAGRIEVQDTDYGFRYASLRRTPAGHTLVRMTVFVMPVLTFIGRPLPTQKGDAGLIIVPRDDESCWRFSAVSAASSGSREALLQTRGEVDAQGNRLRSPGNEYLLDRELQRTTNYTGILGVANQDYAVTESMGPIYDRRQEHLGTTDVAIIRMRQMLLQAAKNLEQGIEPPGLDPSTPFGQIRAEEKIIAAGDDWHTLATEADPAFRELVLGTQGQGTAR